MIQMHSSKTFWGFKQNNGKAFQWKMSFNPGPSKQAQEVTFTHKVKKVVHPPIFFNNKQVQQVSSQKHLDLYEIHL